MKNNLPILSNSGVTNYKSSLPHQFLNLIGVYFRMGRFLLFMTLLAHWSGCIQFLVAKLQGWPEDSQWVFNGADEAPFFEAYTLALFQALCNTITIGYGRFTQQNLVESWLLCVSAVTGATMYALYIGNAANIIGNLDVTRRAYRNLWKQLEEYMAYRELPRALRAKVADYYEHRFGGHMFDVEQIFKELSEPLKQMLLAYEYRDFIRNVPFFNHGDPNFVKVLSSYFTYEFYQPGDVMVKQGAIGDRMYYLQKGVVELYFESTDVDDERRPPYTSCLGAGSYFGGGEID